MKAKRVGNVRTSLQNACECIGSEERKSKKQALNWKKKSVKRSSGILPLPPWTHTVQSRSVSIQSLAGCSIAAVNRAAYEVELNHSGNLS